MTEIVKINAADYGLEESKAKQISEMFKPMLDKMELFESEYNEIIKLEISKETCEKAYKLRQKYVKVRTGTATIHKELKSFYLQGGRFVDGWKNAQLMASEGIEDKLTGIEKHFENLEIQRRVKLSEARTIELSKYVESEDMIPGSLGDMPDDVWSNYLTGTKANSETRKEAERKAEVHRIEAERKAKEEKIAREKAEAKERERIRLENIKLKKEAEERKRKEKIEADKREKAETERLKKEAAERKVREKKERKEREAYELKLKKECEKAESERKEREKAENELRLKRESEQKAIEDEDARIQAELSMNDIAKVLSLNDDLTNLKAKYSFKSKKNQKMYSDVGILIDKIIDHVVRASDAS